MGIVSNFFARPLTRNADRAMNAAAWGKKGAGWFNGLNPTAKYALAGAAIGGSAGLLGPAAPFSDWSGGGGLSGAASGALAGGLWGRFGAGRNLMGRGMARGLGFAGSKMTNPIRPGVNKIFSGAQMFSNKFGDRTMGVAAAASAGLIGRSILSSNNPY